MLVLFKDKIEDIKQRFMRALQQSQGTQQKDTAHPIPDVALNNVRQ